MSDRILSILGGFRRRLVFVLAVEAGAVGGAAGALSAAALMGGWTLAGKFPIAAILLCVLPLASGIVLTLSKRLRCSLQSERAIQWFVITLLTACGFAGLICVLTGIYINLPKNWLFLIFPAGAFISSVIILVRGAALRRVAVLVDRRRGLRERFSTALELIESGESLAGQPFACAVRRQAIASADEPHYRRVSFWNRTRATGGALGLAVVAATLMLAVEPLESLSAKQQRRWDGVSIRAGENILKQLAAIKEQTADDSATTEQIHKLEKLAENLRAARPADAKQWRGKVVELDEIIAALRETVQSGKVDSGASERIGRLIEAMERVAAGITEGMISHEYAGAGDSLSPGRAEGPQFTPPARTEAPWSPLTVYNPLYTPTTATTSTDSATTGGNIRIPYEKAWADARRRAAEAMDKGNVPAEYRQLVRDFFDTDR
ncbi:MAG: hypothetical protein SVV80_00775 [Planctomycetota bacterium]|nr:hypothetical protein [Planctomycetota bacterium]